MKTVVRLKDYVSEKVPWSKIMGVEFTFHSNKEEYAPSNWLLLENESICHAANIKGC